jgi:arylsulfatase A-like enzyme
MLSARDTLGVKRTTRRIAVTAFPNLPVALIVTIGFATEFLLFWNSSDSVFSDTGIAPVYAVAFLFWFWLTVGWGIWLVGAIWNWLGLRLSRPTAVAARISIILFAVCCLLTYVSSWGLYLQTGRFMNLAALQFLATNSEKLWSYLSAAQPQQLAALVLLGTAFAAGLPSLLAWVGRSHWTEVDSDHASKRHLVWRYATVAMLLVAVLLVADASPQRRTRRFAHLKCSLNPTVTLIATSLEAVVAEPIKDCLDASELWSIASSNWAPPEIEPRHAPSILFVAIESLRHKVVRQVHQGREITPNLNKLADKGLHLTRAYAQSTHSDYADVCLVSSLYPLRSRRHHYYRRSDPWPKTCIYDVLKPAGYATAIISSQNEAWGCMDEFLDTGNLDYFYHPQRSSAPTHVSDRDPGFAHEIGVGGLVAGKFRDCHTTDVAIEWIRRQVSDEKPFFLSLNFQSSHFPYPLPEEALQPFQPSELDADIHFMDYPPEKTQLVRNAYFNAIHECDRQLGRLVAALEACGRLDDTILVVTGENGEAFHENGSVGHAREPVQPAIHIACVIHAPGRTPLGEDDYPFEHVDLAPTVLGLIGCPPHPNFQGIDILAEDRPPAVRRLTFTHVLSPVASADSVMLGGRWKYLRDYQSSQAWLFDVATDPGETENLAGSHPNLVRQLSGLLTRWRNRQLAYYYLPHYYQNYYPPRPPAFRHALESDEEGHYLVHKKPLSASTP